MHFNHGNHGILDRHPLNHLDNHLYDLIETSGDLIHLRETQTGKYILGNTRCAQWFGLELSDKLVGLTINDLVAPNGIWKLDFSPAFERWKQLEPGRVNALNNQVKATHRTLSVQRIFCTYEGFLEFRKLIKLPVFNDKRKVIAILSVSQDLTLQCSLSHLLTIYRQYYSDERAVQQILKYVNVDRYFVQTPTLRELQVLFSMHAHTSRKHVASHLNISPNTLASHIQHLKDKLITPSYNEVLLELRVIPVRKNDQYAEPLKNRPGSEYF